MFSKPVIREDVGVSSNRMSSGLSFLLGESIYLDFIAYKSKQAGCNIRYKHDANYVVSLIITFLLFVILVILLLLLLFLF